MALFYILFNERLYYFVFTNITFFGIKGNTDFYQLTSIRPVG